MTWDPWPTSSHYVEVNEMNALTYGAVAKDRFVEYANHRPGTVGGGMSGPLLLPCMDRDHAEFVERYLVADLGLSPRHVRVRPVAEEGAA